ncbi:hypothetical protein BK712_05080 [Bacillus thuringiensis serovar seoulensis]|nr:hypothetical protein BK712_05080 [Bacillus thuringiensis serovar seoulensis]
MLINFSDQNTFKCFRGRYIFLQHRDFFNLKNNHVDEELVINMKVFLDILPQQYKGLMLA